MSRRTQKSTQTKGSRIRTPNKPILTSYTAHVPKKKSRTASVKPFQQSKNSTREFKENAKHGFFKGKVGGKNPSSYFQTYSSTKHGQVNYNGIVLSVANQIKQNEKRHFEETRKNHLKQLRSLAQRHATARQKNLRPNSNTPHKKACTAAYARKNGVKKAQHNLMTYRQLFKNN